MRFLGLVSLVLASLSSATPVAVSERQSWKDECTAAFPSRFTISKFIRHFNELNPETDVIDFSFLDNNLLSTTCHWNRSSAVANLDSRSSEPIYACKNPSVRFGFLSDPVFYLNIYEVVCFGSMHSEVHGGTSELSKTTCEVVDNGNGGYNCTSTAGSSIHGSFKDLGDVQA